MGDRISSIRRWSRALHRDLSYLFAGVMLVYAMSGFMLNHKSDFNSDYAIEQHRYTVANVPETIDDEYAMSLLDKWNERENFAAVYDYDDVSSKIFIRGGSSLLINRTTGDAVYESVQKRHVLSALNRLHYNPSRYWTIFSDIFLLSVVIIILTGLIMVKGRHGLLGRGGVELLIGIAIPILFMLL